MEEDIWSPTYGLKGKIDASVQVLIRKEPERSSALGKNGSSGACGETYSWTMPLEIKTGRAVGVLEHRAQTILYTLLMAERYGMHLSLSYRRRQLTFSFSVVSYRRAGAQRSPLLHTIGRDHARPYTTERTQRPHYGAE